jgi:heptosyltransferase-1
MITGDSSPGSQSKPPFDSVLIVRLSAMGDVIHTLPAVEALRQALPNVTLGWLVEERWAELLCTSRYPRSGPRSSQRPLVDRVHTVNTSEWRRAPFSFNSWQQIAVALSQLRGIQYDAVIDFQGAVRSSLLARWSGAPIIFGSAQPRENAASMLYTRKVLTDCHTHVVDQAFALARAVAPAAPDHSALRFPVDPDSEKKISALIDTLISANLNNDDLNKDDLNKISGPKRFAILNPGAGWGAKCWPAERYAEVANQLAKLGVVSLVNYGPNEDALAAAVETASRGAAKKVSCTISELIALTRRASLFIGGDTGPLHLAAALKIPVVTIFGPTDPARNGPYSTKAVVLRSPSSVTDHSRHRGPEPGLLEVQVPEVVAAARRLLQCETGVSLSHNHK